jgi:hypothetical protein
MCSAGAETSMIWNAALEDVFGRIPISELYGRPVSIVARQRPHAEKANARSLSTKRHCKFAKETISMQSVGFAAFS